MEEGAEYILRKAQKTSLRSLDHCYMNQVTVETQFPYGTQKAKTFK